MTNAWCVRAEFGTYTPAYVEGGYVAIGWLPKCDLSGMKTRQQLYPIYKEAYPTDTSNIVVGIQRDKSPAFYWKWFWRPEHNARS